MLSICCAGTHLLQGFFYPEATVCAFMHAADNGFSVTSNSYYTDPWLYTCKNDASQNAIFVAVNRCGKTSCVFLAAHTAFLPAPLTFRAG